MKASREPKAQSQRPKVGISRCLVGDAVRYDGTDKRAEDVLREIGGHVEWVPVCPEVEVGMGTPREPIELVPRPDGVPSGAQRVRMIGVESGDDWTDRMTAWTRDRVRELETLGLSGYIFKARSPSCGLGDRPGLFAHAILVAMPNLPVADEDQLKDPGARADFLQRVLAFHS